MPLQERAGSSEDAMNLNEKGTEEIVVSDHLKMDNVRLQSLLFEVERARSGTIKALLHVNSLLNKVISHDAENFVRRNILAIKRIKIKSN